VPETVHHAVIRVDPKKNLSWQKPSKRPPTDGVHANDQVQGNTPEALSEAIKILKVLTLVQVIDRMKIDQALIFVRTKIDADNLEDFLLWLGGGKRYMGKAEKGVENAYSCVVLHGDRPGPERKRNYQAFKDGDVRFLICTDVAARGLDIAGLPYVINMTLPDKSEDYIHRVGRTGRAETMGLAISLVATDKEKVWYHQCPSRGKSCNNTRLVEQGGCTIWYDEPQLLKGIEERLGTTVEVLDDSFRLVGAGDKVQYGQKREDSDAQLSRDRLEAKKPAIERLRELEIGSQHSFLLLRQKYQPKAMAR